MSALKGSQVDNLTFHLKKPGKENKLYDKGGLAADGPGGGGRRGIGTAGPGLGMLPVKMKGIF